MCTRQLFSHLYMYLAFFQLNTMQEVLREITESKQQASWLITASQSALRLLANVRLTAHVLKEMCKNALKHLNKDMLTMTMEGSPK